MLKYIHGSEDSLDVDVFYVFNEMPNFKECQDFCSNKEENRNIIVIENGIVTHCFKGTIDEINNGLYYTYNLHKQDFDNVIAGLVERDVLIKTIRVVRCLLSHCSRTQYRSVVKEALRSSSWKKKIEVLRSIDFSAINDYGKSGSKEDVLKVFAFQLGQVFGLINNQELYTKSSIAKEFTDLKKYLYREKDANLDAILKYIVLFIESVSLWPVDEKNGICIFSGFDKSLDLVSEKYAEC